MSKAIRCPFGEHLIFVYPSGRIVPHFGNDGKKCPGSHVDYKTAEAEPKKEVGPQSSVTE